MNPHKTDLPAWNLSDLYNGNDDPKIATDLNKVQNLCQELASKFQGKLASLEARKFLAALKAYEEIDIITGWLGEYAFLQMCTRTNDKNAMAFSQNINEKVVDAVKPAIFFTLEINQISDQKISELLTDPEVAYYRPWLESLRVFKKYELSQEIEEVLVEKSVTSSTAWHRLYTETSSNLKFYVDDKEYNEAEISALLSDKDPEIRAKAGKELNRVAKANSDLFALIYNTLIKDKAIEDQKRGFAKPVSAKNLSSRVEDEVVEALSSAARNNYAKLAHRFYKLKSRWLGVDKLQYWDRNAPLPFGNDKKVSWEESVQTVLDAYNSFSPRFKSIGAEFFSHDWIDVPPRQGKQGGAFCAGTGGMPHPYLLLNYLGRDRDTLTLAHELGHGCHHVLSYPQGDLNDLTPKIMAEVASVFAEMLTFQHLLKSIDDDKARLCLIAAKANDMINTICRQIAFHFYETRMHDERKNGEVSAEKISDIWVDEMQSYLGPNVVVDENSRYIWFQVSYIFEQPFYSYAYSFADCLVNSLYQVYSDNAVPDFAEKYLKMLSETGIKKYDELLEPFGLDAHDAKFWDKGMALVSEYIDELERLSNKLGL